MFTDDDAEMKLKIRAALKSQLVSTYGNDYLTPANCQEKAAKLRAVYGGPDAAAAGDGSRGGGDVPASTKQTDYRAHGSRPAELVNSKTRYGARDVQVPKFQSGVLPREAVSNAYLGPAAQQQGQHYQTTYKSEISGPGGGRVPGGSGVAAADGRAEAELIRWRHPMWEGPVGPVANAE